MMNRVRRPEKADAVRRTVIPVIEKLLSDEQQQHHQRTVDRGRVNAVIPCEREDRRRQR
jgi:hypothetical protein